MGAFWAKGKGGSRGRGIEAEGKPSAKAKNPDKGHKKGKPARCWNCVGEHYASSYTNLKEARLADQEEDSGK